jgi:DNA-binding transcriptional regulator YdaS (Cro superfamily)
VIIYTKLERNTMNPMDLLKIEFGSLKELAEALKIKPNTVYLWGQSNIPFKYLKAIEELTNNKLTREQLRPDLFKKD